MDNTLQMDTVYCEDTLQTLSRMEDNFLDLTVTSPPYNVDLGNNRYNKNPYDLYRDNKEHHEYIAWLANIFSMIFVKTQSGGRCVVNIGDGKNGSVPTHSDIIQMMTQIGWIPMTTIIWNKHQIGNRTSWGSFASPSCPSFPTPFEYLCVFCKDTKKLQWKGETDITKEEFISWSLAEWEFKPETQMKSIGHPSMFPIELPTRCLKLFSWVGSIVYDPFMGAGTTAVACRLNKRYFIGSEISPLYVEIANQRLINL